MKYIFIFLISSPCFGYTSGDFYIDPNVAIGFNPAQGTHYMLGADAGYAWNEQIAFGLHGYYSFGEQPNHDREIAGGPFVSYVQPFTEWLVGSLRQEINYVDLFDPIKTETAAGTSYSHTREMGIASVSRAGVHLAFTRNFGFSFGYRLVIGLSNTSLDNGRSGAFVGLSVGI